MRLISTHVDGEPAGQLNSFLRVEAGPADPGGVPSAYHVYFRSRGQWQQVARLDFQNGELDANRGPNGLSPEVLLAVLIDRLKQLQGSVTARTANEYALQHLQEALGWLKAQAWSWPAQVAKGEKS